MLRRVFNQIRQAKIRRGKLEFRVMLFLVVPLIIIAALIAIKLGYSLAFSTIDVYVKVDSMTSIKKGTPVVVKGFELGRVVAVEPVYKPDLHFLAKMRIRDDIAIDENCSAIISGQNIFGDPVIELRNPEKRGPNIAQGDVIEGMEIGKIDDLLKKVNILITELTATVTVYKEVSQDSKQNIRNLIQGLSGSLTNINSILQNSQNDIVEIVKQMRQTAQTLNEVSVEIKKNPMRFLFQGTKEKKEKKAKEPEKDSKK